IATKSSAVLEDLPVELVDRYRQAGARLRIAEAATAARWAGQTPASPSDIERPRVALDGVQGAAAISDLGNRIAAALAGSPPPDRLRVWQARALEDDLGIWTRRAAAAILREGAEPGDWMGARRRHFEEAAAIQAVSATAADPLSVVTLVLRRLQRMFDGRP
ncbi:MAG TPA: hypothetical protein VFH70_13360, partial [Acidimicrobiales bacterium]|nr:hypothetical protein [Acidimicrobiales bacterium]